MGDPYRTTTNQRFFGFGAIGFLVIVLLLGGEGEADLDPRPPNATPALAQAPDSETPDMPGLNVMAELLSALSDTLQQLQSLKQPSTPSEPVSAWITHYADRFNQRTVGCHDYGLYSSDDPTIVAVNPTLYEEIPCGSLLELCGPGGCLLAARKDSCPGCRPDGFDLSEAGFQEVCGDADGVCTASVRVLTTCQVRKFGKPAHEAALLEAAEMEATGRLPCHPAP